ncbi:Crp/Fnr family transcriptional regulator [Bacillus taeanensis]|uniref:Crp/Fnr family transcriptional regulator n=1 Tax=Bacillus taeanensis TaxID=273032 RepID=A0A366XRP0_9BACI|nr:Crp/Fnr family transcriptional regulator [Bacillus taeanensis]RBW68366.1 Crp/Fnr family transcriptional regulator [Bacillus taeanensis]
MSAETIRTLLKKVPLFKELTENELTPIVEMAHPRQFRARMIIFMQGDPLDRVFFIHKGKVKIYKTDLSGKEQIVSILQEGDMFPHAGFFRTGDYPAHAEIIENATLIVIPISDFEKLLLQRPDVCIKLFKVMGEKIVDLQNRLEEQILHNTYEQILMLLLRLSKAYGKKHKDGRIELTTHFTNREIANMIGTSRETVSRTLTQLRRKEIVEVNAKGRFLIAANAVKEELFYHL